MSDKPDMLDLPSIRALLLDMDGVVYRGKLLLPGVGQIIAFCEQHDIAYACITNNASKTPRQFEQKLAAMGIDLPGSRVLSSSLMTGHYLRETYPRGTTAYVIGMDGLHEAIFGDGYFVRDDKHPQLVVVGIDMHVTYEKVATASLAIRAGAHFIATNTDRTFPSERGLMPGAGSLVAFVQVAAGVEPFVIGKPQPTIFRAALSLLGAAPETTLMVGDRLETDIAGAHTVGLQKALVLTGVTRREEIETSPHQPDAVFEGLPELLAAWQQALA